MRGTYEYAQVNIMVARVIKETDPKTGEERKMLRYLDGSAKSQATTCIPFKEGLKKGTYLVIYQSIFEPEQL